jgi:glycosyltransferase involved in cell wall biosynthesis
MEISAIYPAYNEEENIVSTVEKTLEALRPITERFEILIVNDASRDGTGAIAEDLACKHPEVRVLHNKVNLGQGGSLVEAFRKAKYEFVVHNGMDYCFDMTDLALMIPSLDNADIVVATRRNRTAYNWYRKLVSVTHVTLLHLLFDLKLRDYSFVQLYPRAVWDSIPVKSRSTGFLMPETLIRAHDMGYRIAEVEVNYHPRLHGEASSGKPRVILVSIRDMLHFWLSRTLGMQSARAKRVVTDY